MPVTVSEEMLSSKKGDEKTPIGKVLACSLPHDDVTGASLRLGQGSKVLLEGVRSLLEVTNNTTSPSNNHLLVPMCAGTFN